MLAVKQGLVFPRRSNASGRLSERVYELCAQTLDRCQQELGAATGALFIRREDAVDLLGARGYSAQVLAAFATLPLTARFPLTDCIAENQSIWLSSGLEWERRYAVSIANAKSERQAWCAIPLRAGGHVIAALCLGWADEQVFDEALKAQASRIASDCGASLGELTLDEISDSRLPEGSELAQRIRTLDWTRTPVGPRWTWPAALRSTLATVLSSKRPMLLWWGSELIQFYNDAFCSLLRPEQQQSALGQRARECWAESWPSLEPRITRVLLGEEVQISDERTLVAADGSLTERYFDAMYSRLHDEHGAVTGALVTCTEITSRVLSERRLCALDQLSSELARLDQQKDLAAALPHCLSGARKDLPCVLLYLAQRNGREMLLHALYGGEDQHLVVPKRLHLDDADCRLARAMNEALVADQTLPWSELGLGEQETAAPQPKPYASVIALRRPIPNANVLGFLTVQLNPQLAVDQPYLQFVRVVAAQLATVIAALSERDSRDAPFLVASEQPAQLASRHEQLHLASQWLEHARRVAGIGLFDIDVKSATIEASPELQELVGISRARGQRTLSVWSAAIYEEDILRVTTAVARALRDRDQRIALDLRLHTPELAPRWYRATAELEYAEDGAPLRAIGGVIDIQLLKDTEIAQDTALSDAEKLSEAKDEFFATLSHELRTPLHAIIGWTRMLRESPDGSGQAEHGLSIIERNALAQARLVDDMLDMSRIVSGKLRIVPVSIPLATAVQAAVDVLRPAAEAKGIQLELQLSSELGSIAADPDRLHQVIWNLLSNAVRFTPRLGTITVSAQRTTHSACIEVRDTGQGIDKADLPWIFDRYRQVDGFSTQAYKGMGLGLAIVRHLVEAHGGSIEASSEGVGRGARFIVTLPVADGSPAEITETRPPASAHLLQGLHVLVVDDDDDSRELLTGMLSRAGASVTARPGAEAALSDPGHFDVIVSDIGMPQIDGYELLRRLRAIDRHRDIAAIALTGYATARDEQLARAAGYQKHIPKPVDPARLLAAIAELTRA